MGDLPDQEVGDREERLEDHDGERGHEPEAQQGDHRDGHREDQVSRTAENVFDFFYIPRKNISCLMYFYRTN